MSEANPCPTCGYQIDRVERLNTENAQLRAALKECVDALGSDAMLNAWKFLYVHGFQWTGPEVNLNDKRRLLAH